MIEVQLSKKDMNKTILTLYANMIGHFTATPPAGARSIHVGHIKSIGITTNKKGKHFLVITTEHFTTLDEEVDDDALDKVKEWIAEVQRAMQSVAL